MTMIIELKLENWELLTPRARNRNLVIFQR